MAFIGWPLPAARPRRPDLELTTRPEIPFGLANALLLL
jgi:hypothetical protein